MILYTKMVLFGNTDRSLYNYIYKIVRTSDVPIGFLEYIEKNYRLLLFGGSVRDYVLSKEKSKIRDLDFVIAGIENVSKLKSMIEKYFKLYQLDYNQFGGIKIKTKDITLDIWRLEDTYAFRKGKIKMSIENLINTPMLNIDRYVYDMNKTKYLSNCNMFFPSEIDFYTYVEELLEINLMRALIYSQKYHLKLSSRIKRKLIEAINSKTKRQKMKNFQLYHYGKEIINLNRILMGSHRRFEQGGYNDQYLL